LEAGNEGTAEEFLDTLKGETGASAYVHIRYGTTSNPSTLLTTPADYIGIYSGTSATPPLTAASYTWYKYKGEAGASGASAYVHIRYGTTSNPSTLLTTPADYIGIYSGTSATPPITASSYSWYKIKGDKGDAGEGGGANLSNTVPSAPSTSGSAGSGSDASRYDHSHPLQTVVNSVTNQYSGSNPIKFWLGHHSNYLSLTKSSDTIYFTYN
jgi:hypothetical protein